MARLSRKVRGFGAKLSRKVRLILWRDCHIRFAEFVARLSRNVHGFGSRLSRNVHRFGSRLSRNVHGFGVRLSGLVLGFGA